ncbi:MAG: glycosyltransferase [Clostridia bacterium]|nr:glycosyltransferase [Clostridia bacterium]
MNEVLLSIIVPVYNVEPYLSQCLDSLFTQDISSREYEVICVDDGSLDRCGEILDSYALSHDNMKVFHQKNAGVSAARNKGMDHAAGKYVWFVDSDDMIAGRCLRAIKTVLNATDCDQLIVLPVEFRDGEPVNCLTEFSTEDVSGRVKDFLITRILKRSVIDANGLRFDPHIYYQEDNVFYTVLYPFISTGETLGDRISYYYRVRPNSLSRGGLPSERMLLSLIAGAVEMKRQDERNGERYNGYAYNLYRFVTMITCAAAFMPGEERKKYIGILKENGLFPLKYSKSYTVRNEKKDSGFKTSVKRRIRNLSYTRTGFMLSRMIIRKAKISKNK